MTLPRLHITTDDRILSRDDFVAAAAKVARSGAVAVHLRATNLGGRRWFELARRIRVAVDNTQSLLFVNDRLDLALAVGAHGVHLPEHGLPLEAVRSVLGREILVGQSVHSSAAARLALARGADYVFLGPIFETDSHPDRPPLGLKAIEESLPGRVIAIGGINPERAQACLGAGAYGVAVIRAVWDAPDPAAAAEAILLSLAGVGRKE